MKNKDYLKARAESLISLGEGETAVRTYHCITVNNGENEGYFTVTDRRVILVEVAARGRDCRKTELPIEAVGGIDYRFSKASNAGKIFAGILFFLLCAACAAVSLLVSMPDWAKYTLWGAGAVCLIAVVIFWSVRSISLFRIRIFSSYPMTDFMGFASTPKTRAETLMIKPAADCQLMLKEFGALILDIRQYGAQVREKYLSKVEQKELKSQRRAEESRRRAEEADAAERQKRLDEKQARLEEKERCRRLREQRRLEKESGRKKKPEPKAEEEEEPSQFFDILNK